MYGGIDIYPLLLTSELDGGERSASRPCRFARGENGSSNHCIEVWMSPRGSLDFMKKRKTSFPCQKSNPESSVVHPVA
jgi:hypothetical protein